MRTYVFGLPTSFEGGIKLYANKSIGYIKKEEIKQNEKWISLHKVLVPAAIGTGDSKTDNIKPLYAEPNSCCTETYLVFGPFKSKIESENLMTYIRTKFFHFLVTLQKNTHHAAKQVYSFVPLQDFSKPWTDEELYRKYKLTKKEIDFIEKMIRPMDSNNDSDEEDLEYSEGDENGSEDQ